MLLLNLILASTSLALAKPAPAAQMVVVELFTSQSCSSCPPAEAILRDLSKREDILALEWHVDYWDTLRHGGDGVWKDPYSSPKFTARQRDYNRSLRDTSAVYTPQLIINGSAETVGSRRAKIEKLLDNPSATSARISATKADGLIQFSLTAPRADVILVTFLKSAITDVKRGENKGLKLAEAHIVTQSRKLGTVKGGQASYSIKPPTAGHGCAILVQEAGTGRIHGGAYCPS